MSGIDIDSLSKKLVLAQKGITTLLKVQSHLLPSAQGKQIREILSEWDKLASENQKAPNTLHYVYATLILLRCLFKVLESLKNTPMVSTIANILQQKLTV